MLLFNRRRDYRGVLVNWKSSKGSRSAFRSRNGYRIERRKVVAVFSVLAGNMVSELVVADRVERCI